MIYDSLTKSQVRKCGVFLERSKSVLYENPKRHTNKLSIFARISDIWKKWKNCPDDHMVGGTLDVPACSEIPKIVHFGGSYWFLVIFTWT